MTAIGDMLRIGTRNGEPMYGEVTRIEDGMVDVTIAYEPEDDLVIELRRPKPVGDTMGDGVAPTLPPCSG